ncbi:MAG: hypothetical protein IKO60_01810 [Bacteroidaceae bacterium]|nr:hypothetical protein [Bacteroidaceae bacterium]
MKRIFLSLIAAIAFGVGAMAQDSRVATLQHGTNITAFYGDDALGAAHYNAVDGDIITLSAGEFKGVTINKALTIRGEGRNKTFITSDCTFNIPNGSAYALSIEGMKLNGSASFKGTDGTEKVIVSKCWIYSSSEFSKCNATCINSEFPAYANSGSNVTCVNSVMYRLTCINDGRFDVQNSFLNNSNASYYSLKLSSIKNTIINAVFTLDGTNTSSHCLVKEGCSGFADSWYIQINPNEYDTEAVSWNDLFSSGWHLTEDAAATYLGTDGTQVGIYGGMYPYDTTPDYPLVKRLDVIGSHKDGKLNVKINVE